MSAIATDPDWFTDYLAQQPPADQALLRRADNLARQTYPADAQTDIGEPLYGYLKDTAERVAQMDLLPDAVAATLLAVLPHFQTNALEHIREQCNANVAQLVAGITDVQQLTQFARIDPKATPEERATQAETMRKMLLAMVSDIRVVLIKLALRTRTLQYLNQTPDHPDKRRIAKETLDIFAPLANRLGVWQLKWQLEDLGFRHHNPEAYRRIATLLDEKREERLQYIADFVATLKTAVHRAGIECDVAGRPKHIYSIHKKMVKKKLDFDGLYDIRAVRVLVKTVPECYTVLGIVHSLWQPIPGEFDDYIANPKGNGYQSLHTVIVGPEDKGIEVQIRTQEMHQFNEFGVAAHWRYKEGGQGDSAYEQKIAWLRQLLDWRENMAESGKEDLASAFQTELFNDTIYVLTPHGKVLSLPAGATPIDFAYALHTDLGNRCRGAKVDGQIVPLSTPLENGQRVEIIAAKEGEPSVNWLHEGWVKSNKAISKIRAYIRAQNAEAVREQGKSTLEKALARLHPKPNHQQLCEKLGCKNPDELYNTIGQGEITLHAIQKAAAAILRLPEATAKPDTDNSQNLLKKSKINSHTSNGIMIDGQDGLLCALAKCCKPAPPDDIVGFITRGRGISVHRANCRDFQRLAQQSPEKTLPAQWGQQDDNRVFAIGIIIQAQDRNGLLRDLSEILSRHKINLTAVQTQSRDGNATLRFTLELRQVSVLPRVLAELNHIRGVHSVHRI